jgi:curved DNA-binding protein CbpA
MDKMKQLFTDRIKKFIQLSQNNASTIEIKKEYLKLVKEFHPDANKNIETKLAHEYMITINYVYETLINKKELKINVALEDEFEKKKENGKYVFINDYGIKEHITDKALYIYKLGLLEYQQCYKILFHKSVFEGNKDESGYEIIEKLYKCYGYLNKVKEMDKNGIYGNMAETLLPQAYDMNERITRGLRTSSEKGIWLVQEPTGPLNKPDD